jgi:hypothetical protein
MDKMFWFGWLLKGQMEVSLLDRIIFWGEFVFLGALALMVLVLKNKDKEE